MARILAGSLRFLLRDLRGFVVIAILLAVGCVPIRQMAPGFSDRPAHPGGTAPEIENPEDFKNLGPDAWKAEMEGIASWYGEEFNGRLTASGEVYDMYQMTAAHKTLPLGTVVKVTNQENGQAVQVRINDRGPYVKGRIIDLSRSAGKAIGMGDSGTAQVKLEVVKWPQ